MTTDSELETWQREWHSEEAPPVDWKRRVARETAWMRASLASELVVGGAFVAGAAWLALRYRDPAVLLLAAGIWVLTAVATAFTVRNRLGVLRPENTSVRAFVELTRERRRRDLRAASFGLWFFAVELVLVLGWVFWNRGRALFPELAAASDLWRILPLVVPPLCLFWLLRLGQRARRELRELETLSRKLGE